MISLEMEMDGFVCVETVLQTVEGGITLLTSRMSCTLPFVFFFQCVFVCFAMFCFFWLWLFLLVVVFFSCFC